LSSLLYIATPNKN